MHTIPPLPPEANMQKTKENKKTTTKPHSDFCCCNAVLIKTIIIPLFFSGNLPKEQQPNLPLKVCT